MSQAWPVVLAFPVANTEDLELQISETHRAESSLGFLWLRPWPVD